MRRPVLLALSCLLLVACTEGNRSTHLLPTPTDAGEAPVGGPTGAEEDAAARLARAPAATASSGTARTTLVATVTGLPGRPEPMVLRGEGVIDFAAARSRSVLGVASARGGGTAGDLAFETVTADGLLYVRAPALTSLAGTVTSWVRIDPTAPAGDDGAGRGAPGFGPLAGLAGSDLGAPIALLAGVDASSVREVGTETTDGTTTTSLRATVDPVAASAGGATPDDLTALETFLEGIGARRLEVEAELDEDDRLLRLVYEHEVATPAGPVHQRFDMAYFDFGAAVEVSTPPDDQVRDPAAGRQGPR
jgi:hypothetical protein